MAGVLWLFLAAFTFGRSHQVLYAALQADMATGFIILGILSRPSAPMRTRAWVTAGIVSAGVALYFLTR